MDPSLAPAITRAASKQTYYTIRFLVDRPRVADAYRAYAYFRWVDDVLDAEAPSDSSQYDAERSDRAHFLDRQKSLLDTSLRREPMEDVSAQEAMLVELLRHAGPGDAALESYVRHLMAVMDFDCRRRGRLISQVELSEYSRCLATAVTDAMDYFLGGGAPLLPDEETSYLAVSGAHILHMLRDTYADIRVGYFNVPREYLEANSIGPDDVQSDAYRAWVEERVRLARQLLDAGRTYFAGRRSRRHRLAGLAYIARFDWLIETFEREGFRLRPEYGEKRSYATGLRMGWRVIPWMIGAHPSPLSQRMTSPPRGGA
jgi:hypothetical protein